MILYISKSKIENLYLEACIKKKVSIFSRLNSNISFKINGGVAEINGNLDILSRDKLVSEYNIVLKYIKKQKLLHTLSDIEDIRLFNYYKCKGYIDYNGKVMESQNEELDDMTEYKMKLNLHNYDEMLIHCSNSNMSFVCGMFAGGGPSGSINIKEDNMFVEMIIMIKGIRNKTIIATPLIMSF